MIARRCAGPFVLIRLVGAASHPDLGDAGITRSLEQGILKILVGRIPGNPVAVGRGIVIDVPDHLAYRGCGDQA